MCITKVEAWQFAGKTFPTEGQAIAAAVGEIIGNAAVAQNVIDKSSKLIPLLQRIVEIEAEKQEAKILPATATGSDLEKGQGEPKLSLAELNAGRHITGCRARATGYISDCNCNQDSKI